MPLTDKGCIDQSTGGFGGPDPRVFFNQTPTAEFYGCTNSSTSLPVIEVDQKDGWASINVIHQGGTLEMKVGTMDGAWYFYVSFSLGFMVAASFIFSLFNLPLFVQLASFGRSFFRFLLLQFISLRFLSVYFFPIQTLPGVYLFAALCTQSPSAKQL